jgi:hypothetical protein
MAWPAPSTNFNLLDFILWSCTESRLYHGGKLETRYQSVEAMDEAAVGIKNKMTVATFSGRITGNIHLV